MARNNDTDCREPAYLKIVSKEKSDAIYKGIRKILMGEKHYLERGYSARQLARDLHTNTRYVSVVLHTRFNMGYTALVNQLRVNDAKEMIEAKNVEGMTFQDLADAVGFSTRQSFYNAFSKFTGKTPKQYKEELKARRETII